MEPMPFASIVHRDQYLELGEGPSLVEVKTKCRPELDGCTESAFHWSRKQATSAGKAFRAEELALLFLSGTKLLGGHKISPRSFTTVEYRDRPSDSIALATIGTDTG